MKQWILKLDLFDWGNCLSVLSLIIIVFLNYQQFNQIETIFYLKEALFSLLINIALCTMFIGFMFNLYAVFRK